MINPGATHCIILVQRQSGIAIPRVDPMKRARIKAAHWILLPIALSASVANFVSAADQKDLIAAAERFQSSYERLHAKVEMQVYWLKSFADDEGSIPGDRLVRTGAYSYWRDGMLARGIGTTKSRRMMRGKVGERIEATEYVVSPGWSFSVDFDPQNGKFTDPNINATSPNAWDEEMMRLLHRVGNYPFRARIDILGSRLPDALAAASLRIVDETVDAKLLIRADFEDPWGDHSIWFDPTCGLYPIRIKQHKSSKHWVLPKKTVGDIQNRLGQLSDQETEIVASGLHAVQGAWYPTTVETQIKQIYDGKRLIHTKEIVRIVDISRDPRAGGNDFKLKTTVPNGTRVIIDNQLGVRYEWQNGEVVKSVNQPVAEKLVGQEFRPSTNWWTRPLVWIAVAASALLVGFLVLRWRRQKFVSPG